MKLDAIITERMSQLQLFAQIPGSAAEMVEEFTQAWRELGRELLEQQLQKQVEAVECCHQGARQRRSRNYQTPLGQIRLQRRIYGAANAVCRADEQLGLPNDGWFRSVQELASALGVGSEFANANRLLQQWSGIEVSEKTCANHVEAYGMGLIADEAKLALPEVCPIRSSISAATQSAPERPVFYIGADGIHTPLQGGTTGEAKVGVMFWQRDHHRVCRTRCQIRQREYVATLESVESFRTQLNQRYAQTVQQRPHQVVFLGDGAVWLWLMAQLLFPECIRANAYVS